MGTAADQRQGAVGKGALRGSSGAAASTTTDPLHLSSLSSLLFSSSSSLSFVFYWLVGVGGASQHCEEAEQAGVGAHASEGDGGVHWVERYG